MEKDVQIIIDAINSFHFNEECGFPDTDERGSCEDMSMTDIKAIAQNSNRKFYDSIYDAYKLGYMRASGRIAKS